LVVFYLQLKWTFYIFFKTPLHKRLCLSGFVIGLWLLSFFGWQLASVLRSCYFWFRYVDDVIDQDLKYKNDIKQFSHLKKTLLKNIHSPALISTMELEKIDQLIIDVYYSCLKLGQDNQLLMLTLFEALEYDLIRTETKQMYYTQAEIRQYFDKLDIPSVGMTLQFINEKAITVQDLQALIDATRTHYNLRDFIKDLSVGIVNISIEEIEQYGIDMNKIFGVKSLVEAV
jgi:hypothetical protein